MEETVETTETVEEIKIIEETAAVSPHKTNPVEELEDLIHHWMDEYVSTDGQYMFRLNFVDQCISDLTAYATIALSDPLDQTPVDIESLLISGWRQYAKQAGIPKRVYSSFMFRDPHRKERKPHIQQRLQVLDNIPVMEQKTPEWYALRSQLLTATAISKLFASEAKTNSVIYEKCLGDVPRPPLSINDPRQWGNKYEPVTRQIYETLYRTHVKEYGCIPHSQHAFIGASPDGINVDPKCAAKYGRMVEIKNIVNREITGDPSEEYWIQMQIQMEVCDLDICDFVETRIKEFATEEDYVRAVKAPFTPLFDSSIDTFPREDLSSAQYSIDFHGVVLQFIGLMDPSVIHYEYMPLFHAGVYPSMKKIDKWRKRTIKRRQHEFVYVSTCYWYLDEISVVVVPRNRVWFAKALPEIERVWRTIEAERGGDFSKRKPASRKQAAYSVEFIELPHDQGHSSTSPAV